MAKIAIIGAGWSGISAALTVQSKGHDVTIYERSPSKLGIGGRASTAYKAGEKAPFAIDNGQHVLLGAYHETLNTLKHFGIPIEQEFLRLPANWHVPNILSITLPTWGDAPQTHHRWATGPLKCLPILIALINATHYTKNQSYIPHLFTVLNRNIACLQAAIRLFIDHPKPKETVNQWLKRLKFPEPFNQALWQPLCYATLNTPPEIASAITFKQVIKHGLLSGSHNAAMLIPRNDLGETLPKLALKKLNEHGVLLHLGTAVEAITIADNHLATHGSNQKISIHTHHHQAIFDGVICATTAKDAIRLLPKSCISNELYNIATQTAQPITTIHLKWSLTHHLTTHLLEKALLIIPDPQSSDINSNHILHSIVNAVVLDRSYLNPNQLGWLTMVLSSSHKALQYSKSDLINAATQRLQDLFPILNQATVLDSILIHAKQATFNCHANLIRPSVKTTHAGIVLAGDYVNNINAIYPATLEMAVLNGQLAANILCI